ncbi:olfactory receptor 10A4-like [Xenopus laevis]|uniref:Olfactory receptor 10A4-like n=1 Tax=Xenopus laevis TaxID=8355 RepID=A0A8J1LM81_XENLA|nr:olfactory receptor 10A4-like [Xenopus laevis]
MIQTNQTTVKEFIFLAFSSFHKFQIFLFIVIYLAYIACLSGNVFIIILIRVKPSLQTPMYYFISTLSTLEIFFVSAIIPKLLANLIEADNTISFAGCFTQLFVSDSLGATECFLLAVMAFDRDLAINNPLHYKVIMTQNICFGLAALPWALGFITVLIPTIYTASLKFCGPNEINHFYCYLAPMQNLICSNQFTSKLITNSAAIFATFFPFILILGFYVHIIFAILKMKGAKSKQKAFSTCSAHLIVVCLIYFAAFVVYLGPKNGHYGKFFALLYTVVTPVLNPFIYTFRNKDVKAAVWKLSEVHMGF